MKQKIQYILLFMLAGVVSGLASALTWDVDDNGLILVTLPGWLFALNMAGLFLYVSKNFSRMKIVKSIVWSVFTGVCFFASAWTVIGIDNYSPINSPLVLFVPGFVTTLFTVLVFKLLFGTLTISNIFKISILAGVITYISVMGYLETELLSVLFLPYHVVIAAYFGYLISNKLNIQKRGY